MWIFKGKVVNSKKEKRKKRKKRRFFSSFLFEKRRIDRAPDRHRHACCDDFDLQGLHLAKNRSVIFFPFYFRARNQFRCWWFSGQMRFYYLIHKMLPNNQCFTNFGEEGYRSNLDQ